MKLSEQFRSQVIQQFAPSSKNKYSTWTKKADTHKQIAAKVVPTRWAWTVLMWQPSNGRCRHKGWHKWPDVMWAAVARLSLRSATEPKQAINSAIDNDVSPLPLHSHAPASAWQQSDGDYICQSRAQCMWQQIQQLSSNRGVMTKLKTNATG